MAVQFKFSPLEFTAIPSRNGMANVIQTIAWQCAAEDGDLTAVAYGIACLGEPSGTFTAYEDLTEALVVEWLENALTDQERADLFAGLEQQINERRTPVAVIKPLPWTVQ